MAGRRRDNCVTVQLTDQEKAALRLAAEKAEMPVSSYIRTLVLMALKRGETIRMNVVRAEA
jgi:hypothetical protein